MTPPKTIAQFRDEMAEKEYPVCYIRDADVNFQGRLGFKDGFDASTKYHEEKYRKLVGIYEMIKAAMPCCCDFDEQCDYCFAKDEAAEALKELGGDGE